MPWAMVFAFAVALVPLASTPARAQVFSPGALSKGHAPLDGIAQCTKCHVEGGRHDNAKCLDCHKEIGRRIDAGAGYHNTVKGRGCHECHREHRGEKANLIEWSPSRDAFNHNLTGWPLKGAHKKPECKDCHETRRIDEEAIRALVQKTGRDTFLGLSTRCVECHFDEHRGQEGSDCTKCHTTDEWKKAPGFNHNDRKDAQFALVGKHRNVQCSKCHEQLTDTKTPPDAWPKPRAQTYMQMEEIPHAQCIACHDDVHRGSFGKSCDRCHTPDGWQTIKETAEDSGFHDKHAFKLRGEHQSVSCRACHGPFPGQPAKFKGLKFKQCADCHVDSHVGQIAAEGGVVKCESCHDTGGFLPVLFDITMHDRTRFQLDGSHRAVACNLCHRPDQRVRAKFPARVRADLEAKRRRVLISEARFDMPDAVADALADKAEAKKDTPAKAQPPSDCQACHDDVHLGQFNKPAGAAPAPVVEKKSCATCHATTQFEDLKFTHDQSRFPLEGKHKEVWCAGCHTTARSGPLKGAVLYRPLSAECQTCHADEHVGQLAKNGVTNCADCHTTTDFTKSTKFDHDKQSLFPLRGKHEKVECKRCHVVVETKNDKIARYKPLPSQCAECHEDEHRGAFDDFDPRTPAPVQGASFRPSPAPSSLLTTMPLDGGPAVDGGAPTPAVEETTAPVTSSKACNGCHVEESWAQAKFAHERTGFALSGRHAAARCASCHANDFERPLPATCVGCHVDPHASEFGMTCAACHSTLGFEGPKFPVDAHRRSNFPLNGRHAALPCDECHVEKRDKTFTRAAIDCVACHANDARAASLVTVNHQQAPIAGASCRSCHTPAAFKPATFPQHDRCFPISKGIHAPFTCVECHASLPLAGSVANGACNGPPVICTSCHDHRQEVEDPRHLGIAVPVAGYEFKSEKCAGCHQSPR